MTDLQREVLTILNTNAPQPMTPKGVAAASEQTITIVDAGDALVALAALDPALTAIDTDTSSAETPVARRYYNITADGVAALAV